MLIAKIYSLVKVEKIQLILKSNKTKFLKNIIMSISNNIFHILKLCQIE